MFFYPVDKDSISAKENIKTNKDGLNRSGIEWLTLVMTK